MTTTATEKTVAAKKTTPAKAETNEPRVKAGGAKGELIVKNLKPGLSRQQVADAADATVGRVGEVVRYLRDFGSAEQKKVVKAFLDAVPKRVAAEKQPAPAKKAAAKPAAKKSTTAAKKTTPAKS